MIYYTLGDKDAMPVRDAPVTDHFDTLLVQGPEWVKNYPELSSAAHCIIRVTTQLQCKLSAITESNAITRAPQQCTCPLSNLGRRHLDTCPHWIASSG